MRCYIVATKDGNHACHPVKNHKDIEYAYNVSRKLYPDEEFKTFEVRYDPPALSQRAKVYLCDIKDEKARKGIIANYGGRLDSEYVLVLS